MAEKTPTMQKARAGQSVSDETVALYTAARAFLFGEWFGAFLMVLSFTQLYYFVFAQAGSAAVAVAVGLFLLFMGGFIYWRSRTYYLRLEFPFRHRWEIAATVVAGSGAFFWFLFGVLYAMTLAGKPVMPT